jgi:hypothetical protein
MMAFGVEGSAAVWAGCACVEKRLHLAVQQVLLESVQELFGLAECQAQMLDALGVLLQGDDVSDGFFLPIVAAHDELKFDVHGRAPPGLSGGCMMPAILPEFVAYPQHLHALYHQTPKVGIANNDHCSR